MGATCCSEDSQKLGGGFGDNFNPNFGQLQMVPYEDQTLNRNYETHKADVPSASYAKRINQRPKLFHLVEDSRNKQFASSALDRPSTEGVELPVHYINKYNAYYEGGWKAGKPEGLGRLHFTNGSYFEGPFHLGEIQGSDGIFFYPDGSYKRGHIKNGKLEGTGKFVSRTGFTYTGQWQNDQPHGEGVERYPDHSSYTGKFVNGVKEDDHAIFRWKNGKVYEGPFRNGYMEGEGVLRFDNQRKGYYQGLFSRNLKIGPGKMVTDTGVYEGQFENGEMHGEGVFKWDDGKVYVGHFERGEMHGNGTMYYPNKQTVKGVWHRGENLQMENITEKVH